MVDLSFKYKSAIEYIKKEAPFTPDLAIVLGSGLGVFAESLKKIKTLSTSDIPGYPRSHVIGHKGLIHFSKVENKKILIFQGRIHFYEGYSLSDCVLPVLLSRKLGCDKIILTNAAGGINKNFSPGDLMLIDSFNALNIKKELTHLIGLASVEAKNDFLNCPSKKINEIITKTASKKGIPMKRGIYFYTKGPSYETPAEVEMVKKFGGNAVGMSTVFEAVFASSINMEVAAISCITNMAAGISTQKLNHSEVTETANKTAEKFSSLLRATISRL